MYAKLVDGVLRTPPVEISRSIQQMREAGYKPVRDFKPSYDLVTQDAKFVKYEDVGSFIKVIYEIVEIEPTEEELIMSQTNKALKMLDVNLTAMLTDKQAIKVPYIFPKWEIDKDYNKDERVIYQGVLYKVLQAHKSQATWTPTEAVSLFAKVLISDPDVIPEWEKPSSTNPYMTGDKVTFNGKTYVSKIDNNVWSPTEHPRGWEEVVIPKPDVIPEWKQPDSTNPYMTGDRVTFNGKTYVSKIDNNVWSPTDYPQGWEEVSSLS